MREFRTSGSVGASGGQPPEATRPPTPGVRLFRWLIVLQTRAQGNWYGLGGQYHWSGRTLRIGLNSRRMPSWLVVSPNVMSVTCVSPPSSYY